uniref:Caspase-3A n=1 Tax=Dugesia japonica TaxID=6161 RepID=A0A4Y6I1I1_DUGJA|nr:caspase-3A [Dugesia japonica]
MEDIEKTNFDDVDGTIRECYDVSKIKLCYIINNEEFYPKLNLPTRSGTDEDFKSLKQVFTKLGFKVENYKNFKKDEICSNLRELSERKELKDVSILVCIILTHGADGIIYGIDGPIELDRIFGYFKGDKCRKLIGKPKVFLFQACRGEKFDKGVVADGFFQTSLEKIPVEADFLIGYSTVAGYFSWRNGRNGSWYIQALCRELERSAQSMELIQLLVNVNNYVATNYFSMTKNDKTDAMVQIPSFVCMLRKPLWLVDKN